MKDTKFHTHLNPKLWDKNNKIHPEVAEKLKQIAKAFIDFLGINKDAIKDIVITGSSASYNYTPHSDIDLHLLIDREKVHKDCPIVDDFLISKKSEFNDKHDIFIYGIPVEVYAEDYRNENIHNGLYSLKDNKWVDEPRKLEPVTNDIAVKAKYAEIASLAQEVADKEEIIRLIEKIKKMRRAGLARNGEFSVENLVFKKLRNEGVIDKLMQAKKEGIDKELSLEENLRAVYEGLIDNIIVCINELEDTTVDSVRKKRRAASEKAWNDYLEIKKTGTPEDKIQALIKDTEYADKLHKLEDMAAKRALRKLGEQRRLRELKDKLINTPQTTGQTKQAKEDHDNAQITQGLRNKLEKIYNKNEALGTLCEGLLNVLEDMMAMNTGISGMMDVPYIDYQTGGQEGLHRDVAAKELEMEKIPVRVFHSTDKGGNKFFKKTSKELSEEFIADSVISILERKGISVGKWSTTAGSVAPIRRANADKLKKEAEELANKTSNVTDYIKPDRKYTKKGTERKKLNIETDIDWKAYNNAQAAVMKAKKDAFEADRKAKHAEEIEALNLPKNSKVSANKLTNSARTSLRDRQGQGIEKFNRFERAAAISGVDPSAKKKLSKEIAQRDKEAATAEKERKANEPAKLPVSFYLSNMNTLKNKLENTMRKTDLEEILNNRKLRAQAKEDHDNAQITQGLRNKLEKIYNKNEALGTLCEGLLNILEDMMAMNTGISGMMDVQPTPVAGQRQPSYRKESKSHQKNVCKYKFNRVAHKRKNVQ